MIIVAVSAGDFLLGFVALLSVAAFVIVTSYMIRSIRRESTLQPAGLVVSAVVTVLVFCVYVGLLGIETRAALSWLMLLGGLATGFLWSRTTAITARDGLVFGRRSPWYLVAWAATFALSQALAVFASLTAAQIGLATLFLSTGIALGLNVTLVARWRRARDASLTPAAVACPHCAAPPAAGGERFCRVCGGPLQTG